MTEPFGHEKLKVYQKGMRFSVLRSALTDTLPRRIAYKATIQSAALVDLATVNDVGSTSRAEKGRELARRIAAMLTALLKSHRP